MKRLTKKSGEQDTKILRDHRVSDLIRTIEEAELNMYALVHDLQEPLRAVGTQTQMISRRIERIPDTQAIEGRDELKDLCRSVLVAVDRMAKMVDDTLEFGQDGRAERELHMVDTRAILNLALQNLPVVETKTTIQIGCLPRIACHREKMVRLFQNLLANAIKYRGDQPAQVHISAELAAGDWVFSIRDNGIGIDPRDHDHIFEMFTRARNASHSPGNGLGLATCKSIVQSFGGRIWVESELGKGSTFYFTVPAAVHSKDLQAFSAVLRKPPVCEKSVYEKKATDSAAKC